MSEQGLLVEAGEALFGPAWVAQAAREVGMSPPPLWRMQAGEEPVSAGLWGRLEPVMARRVAVLTELASEDWADAVRVGKHALLARVGTALYGERWQKRMVADLMPLVPQALRNESRNAVSDARGAEVTAARKMQRMAAGAQPIPAALWGGVHCLLLARLAQLRRLRKRVVKLVSKP